jgi:hypothetical protein
MRTPSSARTRSVQARYAIESRHHPEQDHTELARELNAARAEDWALSVAAAAPPLNAEQRVRLVRILCDVDVD